jgi:V/A-type H+-transporting ATPase subunit G/H
MKTNMSNPIQQVLEAEREAKERIERAQREAGAAVSDTRPMAKQLLKRNERRTQQALERYEKKQKQLTEVEAERLRQEASAELTQAQTRRSTAQPYYRSRARYAKVKGLYTPISMFSRLSITAPTVVVINIGSSN